MPISAISVRPSFFIEIGAIAGDQAGLFQRPYPAQAGRRRQADAVGQVLVADAPISLQDGKDLPVVAINLHNIFSITAIYAILCHNTQTTSIRKHLPAALA
jgi:hypothetical protein